VEGGGWRVEGAECRGFVFFSAPCPPHSVLLARPQFFVLVGVRAGGIRIIRLGGIIVF